MDPNHICHAFATFGWGGPQVRTTGIINAMGRRHRHTIVAVDNRFDAASMIDPSANVQYVAPPPGKGGLSYPLAFRRLLKQIDPDLLVTYNWGAMDAVIGAQLGRLCPVLHTEDGFGPDEASSLKARRIWIRRVALARIFGTVVISRTLRDVVVNRYHVPERKVFLIPNGVDTERFRPGFEPRLRAELGIPPEAIVIGTAGRLRPEKNVRLLLEAVGRLRSSGVRLVIVGEGPCRPGVEADIRRLGLQDRVVLAGHRADMAPVYRMFDVFTMSSYTEQLPFALLEAMATGLPCVCTDVGDCAHALGVKKSPEIVPWQSSDAYASALAVMCGDPGVRTETGSKNRERAVAHYSIEQMLRRYERLYSEASASAA